MAEYEGGGGGIGGKIRKRYFRRATPYDRPPTAARPIREHQAGGRRNGWLSKLVDPASRAIAWSASLLFPSVFQRRLEAPPSAASEAKQGSEKEVLEEYHANLLPARQEQFPSHEKNPFNNLNTGNAQDGTHSSSIDGELDQLLTKKTYTRSEYDRIAQILRLRVTETSKPVENNEMGEVPDKVDNQKQCPINPTVQPTSSYVKNNKAVAPAEEAKSTSSLHGNDATQASLLAVSKEEVGSPTEIAKGCMSSRPSELSPTALSMQTQNFLMDRTFPSGPSHGKQSFDKSMALRPLVQHSQPLEATPHSFTNSELHGRSAFNKMTHSPYFKPHSVANTEVYNPSEIAPQNHTRLKLHGRSAIYKMARSPYLKPHSVANPRMLKRGSSVLDDGIGPISPIRRTRHKSNVTSPLRSSFSSVRHFPSSSTYVDPSSVPSSQKLLHWSEQKKNDKDPHNVESIMSPIVPIPPQSSEMARKILEQLDKLAPSPKVKSSNLKIGMDESPLMLTHDILSSPALKSMEKIEMTKFVNVLENGSSESPKDGHHQRNPISEKQNIAVETGSAASDPTKLKRAATEVKPIVSATHFTVSDAATVPTKRKPAFQMSVPEDLDELDDESDSIKDSSIIANGKSELLPDIKTTQIAETRLEASKTSSSNGVLVSTAMLDAKAMKVPNASGNDDLNGLDFPVLPLPGSSSIPSTIPGSAMPLFQPTPLKEKVSSPILKDGLMAYSAGSPSMAAGSDGRNFLASDDNRKGIFSSSDFDKVGKTLKGGDIFNALGNATPSSLSTSPNWSLTSFGVSSTSKLSNDTASLTNESMKPSIFTSSNSTTPSTSVSLPSTVSTSSVPPLTVFTNMNSIPSPPSALSSDSTSSNGLLKFGVPSQPSGASSLFSSSSAQSISFGASAGPSFPSQPVENRSAVSKPLLSTSIDSIQVSASAAPLFGLSSDPTKPLGATSGLTFPTFTGSSSNSSSSTTTMSTLSFGSGSGFSLSRPTISSQNAGSSSSLASTAPFGLSSASPIFTVKSSDSSSSSTVVSSSGFPPSSANASSQSAGSSNSLVSTVPFGSSSAAFLPGTTFSTNFGASTAAFGSSTQESQSSVSVPTFGSISSSLITGFSFGSNTQASQSSVSIPTFDSTSSSPITGFSFGLNTQASQSSVSVSTFNSTSSSPTTGFSFGSAPSGSSPFPFVASSVPAFSFGSTGSTSSLSASPAPSVFGTPNQLGALNSPPGNDQMSVEDSMADDPVQPSASLGTLGQQTNIPSPNFIYGSPATLGGQQTFQFGSQQNNFAPPSPFQPAPNLDFTAGSSFSWGTGGGDKSGRKFVKVRRDKHRRK
ncbi:uncharacterized protein LOC141843540 isoform X2 [Curcuma longa]|uniref:uncharacterized protein LOC141843540 isoform X2 n=1 Tax=Curcuma longa TaxID=136217 RepID=UPI003D9E2C10